MRVLGRPFPSDSAVALLRRRTTVLGIVIAGHLLLVLMLIRLAPPPSFGEPVAVTTFELIPERVTEKAAEERPKPVTRTEQRAAAPPAPPPIPPEAYELDIIRLTRDEYAAADIARLPQRTETASAEAATDASSTPVVGHAPNGERLYKAEWYRRPKDSELAYYLPNGAPRDSWAVIACQTADKYRVENCVELGQSPTAPGLASAIREAAWQFRVLPPRLGGKPMIGAWVSIRIEFSRDAADEDS